ncbi:MAG: hypothetical protein K2O34_08510 [Acetatifactor sp.]|nr:hypothetical protein [Acetatifactor sp.]
MQLYKFSCHFHRFCDMSFWISFCSRSSNGLGGISLALYLTEKLINKVDMYFTMPTHFRNSITCLRDECLEVGYGKGAIRKMMELGADMNNS